MTNSSKDLYYGDYLGLDAILNAQRPESAKHGVPAHEETLFIITHQAYELWFKQILHELASVLALFCAVPLSEKELNTIVARLSRIVLIQKVTNQQIGIMETMTALDFLDFRDYLTPASGFQSVQFREIELRLGLSHHLRPGNYARFSKQHQAYLEQVESDKSLFEYLDDWLTRTPFLKFEGFDFWRDYSKAVEKMLAHDAHIIEHNPTLTAAEINTQLKELEHTRQSFACLFDRTLYEEHREKGQFHLSYEATLAALFIRLYRDEPLLQLPFRLLTGLMDIDQQITAWRSGHALMVQRMVGTKIGTGGSSGHEYLKSTITRKRIFADLFNLSTFLIPRSQLPILPKNLERNLGFYEKRH